MNISSSFSSSVLLTTFSIVCALHAGLVLAVTSPRLPVSHAIARENHYIPSSSSLGMLGVDEEGNLVWKSHTDERATPEDTTKSHLGSVVSSLRGGDLCVDGEGNFYTPRRPAAASKASADLASKPEPDESLPVLPTEGLRGGSHEMQGGLRVDSEGNLFFSRGGPSEEFGPRAAALASTLRGGALEVDNEGNLYFGRQQEPQPTPQHQQPHEEPLAMTSNGRRRSRNTHDPHAIVLAKNDSSKDKPKKNIGVNNNDSPMAFIGYNNALMET